MTGLKLAAVLLVVAISVAPSLQAVISLYDDSNQGRPVGDVDVNGCVTLPAWQNRLVSSVNTHGRCFVLYEHGDCQGARVRVQPNGGDCGNHKNLNSCNFNDRTTSIGNC